MSKTDDPMTPEEMQRIADELRERIRQKFSHVMAQRQGPKKERGGSADAQAEGDDGIFDS